MMLTPDEDEYRFELDAYTLETIPMEKLGEYLSGVAALFANSAYVHFARLEPGSVNVVARVEREAIFQVEERVHGAALAEEGSDVRKAFDRLDNLARRDHATAKLKRRQSGSLTAAQVLYFPGRERPKPERIGPFNQPAVMDGIAIRSGGETPETANVLIQLDDGRVISGEVTKGLAQDIGQHLYRIPLRFQGDARWQRTETGEWELVKFKVRSFIPLNNDRLSEALETLRAIKGSDWEGLDDPLRHVRENRADEDEGQS